MQAHARVCGGLVYVSVCKYGCLRIVVKYMHVRECECYYHSKISLYTRIHPHSLSHLLDHLLMHFRITCT